MMRRGVLENVRNKGEPQMANEIYRDSLSAWQGLGEKAGIELDGRDEDLALHLRSAIDPNAPDLSTALANTTIEIFLQSLFQVIQPFALMFRDILEFLKKAGAIDDQKLLFRQQAIGNNSSCAARSKKFGDRGQQMCNEYQQILHD